LCSLLQFRPLHPSEVQTSPHPPSSQTSQSVLFSVRDRTLFTQAVYRNQYVLRQETERQKQLICFVGSISLKLIFWFCLHECSFYFIRHDKLCRICTESVTDLMQRFCFAAWWRDTHAPFGA
jgi:hypothetical protein